MIIILSLLMILSKQSKTLVLKYIKLWFWWSSKFKLQNFAEGFNFLKVALT